MFWTLMNFGAKGTEDCILAIVWGCFCFATVFLVGFLLLCNLCDVYYSSFHYIIICIIIITCVRLCHLFIIILPVNRSGFIPDLVDLLLFSPASSNTICCVNTIIYCKYHHLLCDPQSTGLLASDLPPPSQCSSGARGVGAAAAAGAATVVRAPGSVPRPAPAAAGGRPPGVGARGGLPMRVPLPPRVSCPSFFCSTPPPWGGWIAASKLGEWNPSGPYRWGSASRASWRISFSSDLHTAPIFF